MHIILTYVAKLAVCQFSTEGSKAPSEVHQQADDITTVLTNHITATLSLALQTVSCSNPDSVECSIAGCPLLKVRGGWQALWFMAPCVRERERSRGREGRRARWPACSLLAVLNSLLQASMEEENLFTIMCTAAASTSTWPGSL